MRLACNRHFEPGAPAGSPCRKCAPALTKNNSVDTMSKEGLLSEISSPVVGLSVVANQPDSPLEYEVPPFTLSPPRAEELPADEVALPVVPAPRDFGDRSALRVGDSENFCRHLAFSGTEGIEQFSRALREGIRRARGGRRLLPAGEPQ